MCDEMDYYITLYRITILELYVIICAADILRKTKLLLLKGIVETILWMLFLISVLGSLTFLSKV